MIHATVIGNLGKDAETKTVASGKIVTNFSVATNGRDKDSTIWVRAAMWGSRGQKVAEYLTKGSRVACTGTISTSEYNGKTYLEVDVLELELLGGKRDEDTPVQAKSVPAALPAADTDINY